MPKLSAAPREWLRQPEEVFLSQRQKEVLKFRAKSSRPYSFIILAARVLSSPPEIKAMAFI